MRLRRLNATCSGKQSPDRRCHPGRKPASAGWRAGIQKASDSIRQIRRLSPDTPLDLLLDNVVSFATSHGAPLRAAFIRVWDETPVEGER